MCHEALEIGIAVNYFDSPLQTKIVLVVIDCLKYKTVTSCSPQLEEIYIKSEQICYKNPFFQIVNVISMIILILLHIL